jgi:Mg/Co/Ni transporter MgtE
MNVLARRNRCQVRKTEVVINIQDTNRRVLDSARQDVLVIPQVAVSRMLIGEVVNDDVASVSRQMLEEAIERDFEVVSWIRPCFGE